RRHRRCGVARSEPSELQPRAMVILPVGCAYLFEGRNRSFAIAEPVANGAQRKPSGGKARRQFQRLHQDIGGAGKVATRRMVERPFVAPVGDGVAGGNEQWAGVGHDVIPGRAEREPGIHNNRPSKYCNCDYGFQTAASGMTSRVYLIAMRPEDILGLTPAGVCCKRGGFHIDPTRPVERALITHAHSDHARAGHSAVLATQETLDLMRLRYGDNFAGTTQAVRYGETVALDGATVTFHPAGHVLGSAQIAVEASGLRIVASGDYKNVPDPT